MIDPRRTNIAVDANVLRLKGDGSRHDRDVTRFLSLWQQGDIAVIVPHTVLAELNHPNTPRLARELANSQIYSLPTSPTPDETAQRQKIRSILQGNAQQGKHWADADHVFEAAKYGNIFVTGDGRVINKGSDIKQIVPHLEIMTLSDFLQMYDYQARV